MLSPQEAVNDFLAERSIDPEIACIMKEVYVDTVNGGNSHSEAVEILLQYKDAILENL